MRPAPSSGSPRALPILVPTVRLELTRLTPLPPQDSVSTNSTTSAIVFYSLRYIARFRAGLFRRRGGSRRRGALRHVGRLAFLGGGGRCGLGHTLLHHV